MIKVLILLIHIAIINIIEKNIAKIGFYKEKQFKRDFLEYGFTSIEDLKELDDYLFYDWLKAIVNKMGYKFIKEYIDEDSDEIKYVYEKNSKVGLMKIIHNSTEDFFKIDAKDLKLDVGFMVSKNLKQGIFITSGEFTNEAKEYIKSLSDKINIVLVDGYSICNKRRQLWY